MELPARSDRGRSVTDDLEVVEVELDKDQLAVLFSGGNFVLPELGGGNLVVKADFNDIERALHLAVEASGWCLHCFHGGVGGPGEGCRLNRG